MTISEITREAVLRAVSECDQRGRDEFLAAHGFGPARGYYLVHNGKSYDSKAIVGVAHGYLGPDYEPLQAANFSGGEAVVASLLERLGFEVRRPEDNAREGLPFEVGRIYNRQRDIHQVYGGQERGGIATPAGAPFVFLFTGESGGQYGYEDGWQDDGTFAYTGEGQRGNMEFARGNKAIRDHLEGGRDLLLFEATRTKGAYRFLGCFACESWSHRRAPDLEGHERQAIVFHLVPVDKVETAPEEAAEAEASLTGRSVEELRRLAYEASGAGDRHAVADGKRSYYLRSAKVKAYVLARAKGRCEACGKPAPFVRADSSPYLEPHHIERLADGGPDHPSHVGAVCPTCHREIHHGRDGESLNNRLRDRIAELEAEA